MIGEAQQDPTLAPIQNSRRFPRGVDLARAATIFLVVFAVYFIGYSRTLPPTADEMIDFGLTESMAKWQIFSIDQVSTVGPNPEEFGIGGHRYSKYGPLQAVLSVPLFWLAQRLPIGEVDTVLLLNHLVTALGMALLFLLVRRMGYGPVVALGIVGVVAFGTPLWVHSKRYFAEPTITLCVIATIGASYVAATTRRPGWLVLAGFAFGAAVASKYVNALLLAPVPVYLPLAVGSDAGPRLVARIRRYITALIWFGIGAAPAAILLALYDLVRFGSPLTSGYAHWETFSTPVWVGVTGFLFSPGKSIFVYTPLFVLVPFWASKFARRFPGFAALLGAIIVLHLCVYGSWWVWWGAWAWGARFIVPILPLVALFLAEGFAGLKKSSFLLRGGVAVLAALSFVIQILGISVDHTVYLVSLIPLNPKPDTLTLWNLRYQPIIHQIPLMTRKWLDFAWMERTGPSAVNFPALTAAVVGALAAIACFGIVWRARSWAIRAPALVLAALIVAGGVYQALRIYSRTIDPTTAAVVQAIAKAPANTGIVQLIPSDEVPYDNWQKRPLPETGWIEEPKPEPIIVRRLHAFEADYPQIWVVTQTPPKVPSNGIEAMLDRSLVQVGDDPVGRFRLLRYVTHPASLDFGQRTWQFGDGIELAGFSVNGGPPTPGQRFDLTLKWRATAASAQRLNYTVFVHLVDAKGKLIAQHDDPPASGYAPTDTWKPGEVIYDDHSIDVPADAPPGLHLIQVGLYLPSNGKRLSLIGPDGKAKGDTVTLDLMAKH